MRLDGKVAFISGGSRGMGAAEARLFAREGAKVAIGDVLEDDGRKIEAEINETGGEALFVRLDVTSQADWERAVAVTVAQFGGLDILVNNAGIGGPSRIGTPPWRSGTGSWTSMPKASSWAPNRSYPRCARPAAAP